MPRIDLKAGEQKKHVARALKEIRAGFVIVAPLEHGYVYLADAFSPFAVRAMHVLRGDEAGVVAQVLAHSLDTVKDISRAVSADTQKLCDEFWSGHRVRNDHLLVPKARSELQQGKFQVIHDQKIFQRAISD